MNLFCAGVFIGIVLTITMLILLISWMEDAPEVDPGIDFEHTDMETLNQEIEIRGDFNLAVKTKPTNENKHL